MAKPRRAGGTMTRAVRGVKRERAATKKKRAAARRLGAQLLRAVEAVHARAPKLTDKLGAKAELLTDARAAWEAAAGDSTDPKLKELANQLGSATPVDVLETLNSAIDDAFTAAAEELGELARELE